MTAEQVDEELNKRQLSTRLSAERFSSFCSNHWILLFFCFVIASGEIEIRRMRLKHYYKAQLTLSSENPLDMIEQHFEYIAVIDFEATCEHNQGNHFPHEIIEFPIVLIHVPKRAIVRIRKAPSSGTE